MEQINPFTSYFLSRVYSKLFSSEEKYYKSFFESVVHKQSDKARVLMYVGIGDMFISPLEILIYHLLRNKGCYVDYYIYDETIPINEVITKDRIESVGKEIFWRKSVNRARLNLVASRVDYSIIQCREQISSIIENLNNLDSIFSFRFDDIEFGEIVKGVMFRYYKSLKFGSDSFDVARNFLITSLTNYFKVKELHAVNKYDYVMFSHGIYCTWEPVVLFCKKNNIPFVCYDRAKVKGQCNFNLNIPAPVWDISEAWKRLKDYCLSNRELERVSNYLRERELQKGDVYAYNFTPKEKNISNLKQRYNISENVTIITIFTNLIWDAANVSRDIAFSSPLECIAKTINKYSERKDVHIVIRSHPAEKVLGTSERYGELVRCQFSGDLPSNVTIIEPEDSINSFSVLELSDIGVVHTSTVGLEMAIEGKPVIVISDTHYRDKGFTYDAFSEEDYFLKLDGLITLKELKTNQIELALKYFYLMMFEYQHKMPMTFTKKDQFNGYGYRNFEELSNDSESSINRIIERICSKELFTDFVFRD